jgi:hypothetical protein
MGGDAPMASESDVGMVCQASRSSPYDKRLSGSFPNLSNNSITRYFFRVQMDKLWVKDARLNSEVCRLEYYFSHSPLDSICFHLASEPSSLFCPQVMNNNIERDRGHVPRLHDVTRVESSNQRYDVSELCGLQSRYVLCPNDGKR